MAELWPAHKRFYLFDKVIETFGYKKQMAMVIEEMGELLTAIARIERGRTNGAQLATEIADVIIMLEQLQIMTGTGQETTKQCDFKLSRLERRVNDVRQKQRETYSKSLQGTKKT